MLRALLEKDVPDMPKKRRNLDIGEKAVLWERYCGEVYQGRCFCCDRANLTPFNFHCGHIQAFSKGGEDTLDNFRPICSNCNLSMKSMNMQDYMRMKYPEQYEKRWTK